MKKRGLSTVVITLIIILISLVAVGIIWVVVRNVIQTGTKEVTIGQFTLDAKIKDVNVYNFSNNVSLTLKRNPGVGEFNKMNFVFYDGKSSEVITQPVSLNELEEKWFMFHLGTINVSNLRSISIFPYVKQDEKEILGNILDKYTISGQGSAVIPACIPLINNYCSVQGYVCGNWGNGTCGGNLNCGACGGATPVCNSSGKCAAACTPLINNYCSIQGYVCGNWGNNTCSGNLSCGTCGTGNCNATGRCVDVTAPVRSNAAPTGILPAGTTQTTISLSTDENAICRYSLATGTAYVSMTNTFTTTGTTSHSKLITGLVNGQTYNYYVKCNDTAGNFNTNDYTIRFSVAASSSVITALSCSQADVQSAINSASDGYTVLVPAGTCLWTIANGFTCYDGYTAAICVRKGIKLQGGFGGTTTINMGSEFHFGGLQIFPNDTSLSNNATFEVTGFTLDALGKAINNEGLLAVRNTVPKILYNLKIHGNVFKNCTSTSINVNGAITGIIYENTFTDSDYSVRSMGGDSLGWSTFARQYGQSDNLFVEDNKINFTIDMSGSGETSNGQGAPGVVFRYNIFNLSNTAGGYLFDVHGLQSMTVTAGYDCSIAGGCGYSSCLPSPVGSCNEAIRSCEQWSIIKSETYGNIVTDTPYLNRIMQHRGSWLMMFDNQISSAYPTPAPIDYSQYSCDSCQSPSTPAYSQHIQNTYVFNNLYNGVNNPMIKGLDFCGDASIGKPYTITENVDYWNYNSSFDGKVGIGRGLLTNRPSTCTTGVGYWATDQGEWNSKHSGADGQFYKCISANNWQLYYTPYPYPHPQRGS